MKSKTNSRFMDEDVTILSEVTGFDFGKKIRPAAAKDAFDHRRYNNSRPKRVCARGDQKCFSCGAIIPSGSMAVWCPTKSMMAKFGKTGVVFGYSCCGSAWEKLPKNDSVAVESVSDFLARGGNICVIPAVMSND